MTYWWLTSSSEIADPARSWFSHAVWWPLPAGFDFSPSSENPQRSHRCLRCTVLGFSPVAKSGYEEHVLSPETWVICSSFTMQTKVWMKSCSPSLHSNDLHFQRLAESPSTPTLPQRLGSSVRTKLHPTNRLDANAGNSCNCTCTPGWKLEKDSHSQCDWGRYHKWTASTTKIQTSVPHLLETVTIPLIYIPLVAQFLHESLDLIKGNFLVAIVEGRIDFQLVTEAVRWSWCPKFLKL